MTKKVTILPSGKEQQSPGIVITIGDVDLNSAAGIFAQQLANKTGTIIKITETTLPDHPDGKPTAAKIASSDLLNKNN